MFLTTILEKLNNMKIKSKVSELLGETVTFKDRLGKIRTAKVVGLVEYAGETIYPDKFFILNYIEGCKITKADEIYGYGVHTHDGGADIEIDGYDFLNNYK